MDMNIDTIVEKLKKVPMKDWQTIFVVVNVHFFFIVLVHLIFGKKTSSKEAADASVSRTRSISSLLEILVFDILIFCAYLEMSHTPVFGDAVASKPYRDFQSFYDGIYLNAHIEPASVKFHFFIFSAVLIAMGSDPALFSSWTSALATGMLLCRPFSHLSVPFLESLCMTIVGSIVAARQDVLAKFTIIYFVWVSADFFDHVFLGNNGSDALYFGADYLSWALVGQSKLWYSTGIKMFQQYQNQTAH